MTTFVLTDSSEVNSYGFRIDIEKLSTGRFQKNPVMLYQHDYEKVIGRWENLREENGRLLADAVFDEGDTLAMEVKRKVEDGFLKGCSVGIKVNELLSRQGGDITGDSELIEASIVTVPADKNAVALYEENEKGVYRLSYTDLILKYKTDMEVKELKEELEKRDFKIAELTAEVDTLKKELAERDYREAEKYIDKCIAEGKFKAEAKSAALSFYLSNPKDFSTLVGAIDDKTGAPRTAQDTTKKEPEVRPSDILKHQGTGKELDWDTLDKEGRLQDLKEKDYETFCELYFKKFNAQYVG